jgi:hypothetical protein
VSANVTAYNSGVVRPIECLKMGWSLIKEKYWLFLGITAVGILVGSMGPMAILLGPMMCGIFMCLLARFRGEQVGFDMLFKGFDYFAQSLIATLIQTVPVLFLILPVYVIFFIQFMSKMGPPSGHSRRTPVDPSELYSMFALMGVMVVVVVVIATLIGTLFIFTYPLIVDRRLSALDAIRTSIRAVRANFGGVLGLVALNTALGLVGMLFCYVGAILVMPVSFAAWAVAYRQVFPAQDMRP